MSSLNSHSAAKRPNSKNSLRPAACTLSHPTNSRLPDATPNNFPELSSRSSTPRIPCKTFGVKCWAFWAASRRTTSSASDILSSITLVVMPARSSAAAISQDQSCHGRRARQSRSRLGRRRAGHDGAHTDESDPSKARAFRQCRTSKHPSPASGSHLVSGYPTSPPYERRPKTLSLTPKNLTFFFNSPSLSQYSAPGLSARRSQSRPRTTGRLRSLPQTAPACCSRTCPPRALS